MGVNIVRMNMSGFRNPNAVSYSISPNMSKSPKRPAKKAAPATQRSKSSQRSKSTQRFEEKLTVVTPSGKRDDSFFDLVHQVARQIPRGRVTSYGAIGRFLGSASSARMVGWAMASSHSDNPPIPAHRVVNSSGLLSGRHHFTPPERMEQLLLDEGVKVKDYQVVDFNKLFWDPSEELF
jgi:methylated-DNA-protein-cysteine methyltransferase-like protein